MNNNQVVLILSDPTLLSVYLPGELTLTNFIDEGGQGIVYKGKINGEDAAIKFYKPGQVEKRVEREIEALRTLDSPYIVKLLWNGEIIIENHNIKVAACEFIEGQDLGTMIGNGPLNENQIGRLIYDISLAINEIWKLNIVHRDIKPNNIMIRADGSACVIDLGYARHIDKSTQTQFGYVCGTRGYYSFEQAHGQKQLTWKSDIYSLGILVLEASLGYHPTNLDQMEIFNSHFYNQLPEPIASWQYANIVKKMFENLSIKRPTPNDLVSHFSQFSYGGS